MKFFQNWLACTRSNHVEYNYHEETVPIKSVVEKEDASVKTLSSCRSSLSMSEQNDLALEALSEIKRRVETDDILSKSNLTWIFTLLDCTVFFILAAWMFMMSSPAWAVGAVWTLAQFRAILTMHMAIHRAVFNSDRMHDLLGIVSMNFFLGVSWRWWRYDKLLLSIVLFVSSSALIPSSPFHCHNQHTCC